MRQEIVIFINIIIIFSGSVLVRVIIEIYNYVPEHAYEVTWPKDEYDEIEESEAINTVHLVVDLGLVDVDVLF